MMFKILFQESKQKQNKNYIYIYIYIYFFFLFWLFRGSLGFKWGHSWKNLKTVNELWQRAAHDKSWRWEPPLTRLEDSLVNDWTHTVLWCIYPTLFRGHITLTLWTFHDSFLLVQLYVWWIKFTLERSQPFQIFHFWWLQHVMAPSPKI